MSSRQEGEAYLLTETKVNVAPPPDVPGNTEAKTFDNAVRKMSSVSKEAFLEA